MIIERESLTVNSPVLGSNPTCTVCSKSIGEDISGLSFPGREGEGEGEIKSLVYMYT